MFQKKSLGQNFLKNGAIIDKIVDAGFVSEKDTVVEIGPGKGVLTRALLAKGACVIAIEKDDRLIPILSEEFVSEIESGKLELVHGDIVEMNISDLGVQDKKYKLVANIPYYITGLIVRMFLETDIQPAHAVVRVQKEVAQRIVARDIKESLLSISVKAYGEPHNAGVVKAGNFNPAPSVDSAILSIHPISKAFFETHNISEKRFFQILKVGFAGKRKMLVPKLTEFTDRATVEDLFNTININLKARAEDIALEDWARIVQGLK